MAMLDEIFLDELVDDPEPMLVEEPQALEDNQEDDEQPPPNPSAPSEDAVRVAPKKTGVKRQYVMLNPQKVTGPRGIQCIEQYFKNVKLKGKGHELSDLNTVMSHLEHWANRMYPRSRFDDVLKRLEVLGHKRPVMTHLKKIRLGMVQEPELDSNLVLSDTEAPAQPPTSDDIFNELLATQPSQHTNSVKEITEAQRERMARNRRLAEEKRQARLAAEAERASRDQDNARTLQGIEFQTALLETQGSERASILNRGELLASQSLLDKSVEALGDAQDVPHSEGSSGRKDEPGAMELPIAEVASQDLDSSVADILGDPSVADVLGDSSVAQVLADSSVAQVLADSSVAEVLVETQVLKNIQQDLPLSEGSSDGKDEAKAMELPIPEVASQDLNSSVVEALPLGESNKSSSSSQVLKNDDGLSVFERETMEMSFSEELNDAENLLASQTTV